MHSNGGAEKESSGHDAQELENLELLEEVNSTTLENSSHEFSLLPKTRGSLGGPKEVSTIATQTPLTLIRLTLSAPQSDKRFIDSTTSPTRFNQLSINEANEARENAKSLSGTLVRSQVSIMVSREARTQATPPHPLAIHSIPETSRDTLQISTSFSSTKSERRNEIFTLATDYGSSSSDSRSILINAIGATGNGALHLSVRNGYERSHILDVASPAAERMIDNSPTRRMNHRRWSLSNCLRCMSAIHDQSDTRPYMRDAPPTYSAIHANRATIMRHWRPFRSPNQSSFVAPIPPPSYAQALGIGLASYSTDHLFSVTPSTNGSWSPRPTTTMCPRCTMTIVTTIEVRQSIITHVAAFALFLCGCWPCCMIPYCVNSCKNIEHFCPVCRAHLGTYRPW